MIELTDDLLDIAELVDSRSHSRVVIMKAVRAIRAADAAVQEQADRIDELEHENAKFLETLRHDDELIPRLADALREIEMMPYVIKEAKDVARRARKGQ